MNEQMLICTKEIGKYRIKVYYDEWAECPVTSWDMAASYIFSSGRDGICSECDWKEWVSDPNGETIESILRRIAAETVEQDAIIKWLKAGKVNGVRFVYNRSTNIWELQCKYTPRSATSEWYTQFEVEPSDLKAYDYRMELLESFDEDDLLELIQECAKDFVIKAWSSCGYSQGDYMYGIAYTTKKQFKERCGFNPQKYKTWQEQALEIIDAEVKEIGMWAWGDVKGFVLEEKVPFTKVYHDKNRDEVEDFEWNEVDSCWGYFLESEELINEVISEHSLKEAE